MILLAVQFREADPTQERQLVPPLGPPRSEGDVTSLHHALAKHGDDAEAEHRAPDGGLRLGQEMGPTRQRGLLAVRDALRSEQHQKSN